MIDAENEMRDSWSVHSSMFNKLMQTKEASMVAPTHTTHTHRHTEAHTHITFNCTSSALLPCHSKTAF